MLTSIKNRIKELKLGQSALLAGSAGIGQGISYLFMPVLSRVYTTEDYSIFSLFYAWIVPLAVFSTFRIEFAIPHQNSSEKRFATAYTAIKTSVIWTIVTSFIVLIGWGIGWLKNTGILIWIPLGILSVSIPQVLYFLSTRENQYKKSGLYRIINNLVLQSSSAILGWMFWGSTGLIVGMLIGQLAGALTLIVGNGKKLSDNAEKRSWIDSIKEFRSYILYSTPQGLIETLQLSGTIFIIYYLFNDPYPGLFYLCWRILQSPITLISNTIFVVHYNNASQLKNQNQDYQWLIKKTAKLLFLIGGMIGLVLFLFGPLLFALILGEPWREAGEMARILAPLFVLQFSVTPFSFVAILENKQQTAFLLSLMDIVLKGISLFIGSYYNSISIGLSLYTFFGALVLIITYLWYLKQSKNDF